MSNCVVGSVGLRLPHSIIAEHSVEGSDHFSHDGDDNDLGFLVGVGKTVGEGLESGIVSACAEGLVTQTDVWVHHCAIGPSSDDGAGCRLEPTPWHRQTNVWREATSPAPRAGRLIIKSRYVNEPRQ